MKLEALRSFTQASYRNMKSYFTSKLIEHTQKKTNKRIRIIKPQELRLDIYYSSCFIEYHLYPIACCLPHLQSSVYVDSWFFPTSEANSRETPKTYYTKEIWYVWFLSVLVFWFSFFVWTFILAKKWLMKVVVCPMFGHEVAFNRGHHFLF